MITIDFNKRGQTGLCDFLYESIKNQIMTGELSPSEKLPSKRALATHLGISVITVQNAYAQLISEGYMYSIEKKGFFVSEFSQKLSKTYSVNDNEKTEVIDSAEQENQNHYFTDFTANSTNVEKFPFTLWSHLIRQILNTGDEKLLKRSDVSGSLELRKAIANHLRAYRNMTVSPEQIIIGAGTEALYSMLVLYLGRDKKYAIEDPGYNKVRDIIELNGASCVTIKIDDHGINPQELEKNNVQVVYASPNHHFPTGTVMPLNRRLDFLEWLNAEKDRFIIEDDYDSEFRFSGKPLPTLQTLHPEGQIVYMNTFTKTLSPSFRISYMVLPQAICSDFKKKLCSYSCQVSAFEQFTLAKFISEGYYESHLNKMRNYYRSVRNSLISDLQKSKLMEISSITEEDAGLHFLLTLNTNHSSLKEPSAGLSPQTIKDSLLKNGIKCALLSDYYYDKTDAENSGPNSCTFVINYSAIKRENISETIKRMEKAILYN